MSPRWAGMGLLVRSTRHFNLPLSLLVLDPSERQQVSPPLRTYPQSFWTRLSGKYGNKFYWQEQGEAKAILDAVSAVDTCLREEPGRFKCSKVGR